ncbi:C40 family peptidase [Sphingobacterium yanglingense]|uniref:CHAP domain-containing protein n=1 Tax=Sphingobacterium yanglingense TaxID=1437280 RepID=A0A4R6WND7_9SPHI|nr:hypothetical protein [Sphingobacterium yanglingense]TDQ80302.1 hypothetical protein CLV99_1759 [Sphingobacterium yanglingense]
MATMYYLFLGFLFIALCSDNGDGSSVLSSRCPFMSLCLDASGTVMEISTDFTGLNYNRFLCRSVAAAGPVPFLLTEKEPKGQGLVARLNCLLISGNKTNSPDKSGSNKSDCLSEIIDNSLRLAQPRPIYLDNASTSLQLEIMSPVKQLAIKDDLLAYGDQGRKATNRKAVYFALGQESQSKGGIGGQETLGPACVALRRLDEHRVNSLDLCGTFYQGKVPRQSANEDRIKIINIASAELGVHEATGHNDGPRVEEYLRYTNLGPHHEWCAAFVSWCYGQAGLEVPRSPWSPALFPKARQIAKDKARPADVFGIYGAKAKRINHVGLIKELSKDYLITIEGNSNDRVESRRRHLRTVYAVAKWVE